MAMGTKTRRAVTTWIRKRKYAIHRVPGTGSPIITKPHLCKRKPLAASLSSVSLSRLFTGLGTRVRWYKPVKPLWNTVECELATASTVCLTKQWRIRVNLSEVDGIMVRDESVPPNAVVGFRAYDLTASLPACHNYATYIIRLRA